MGVLLRGVHAIFFCMLYQYHDINISITYNMRSSQCICMYIYIYTYCAHTDLSWIQIIVDRMMVSDKLQDLIPGHPLVNKDHIDPNT